MDGNVTARWLEFINLWLWHIKLCIPFFMCDRHIMDHSHLMRYHFSLNNKWCIIIHVINYLQLFISSEQVRKSIKWKFIIQNNSAYLWNSLSISNLSIFFSFLIDSILSEQPKKSVKILQLYRDFLSHPLFHHIHMDFFIVSLKWQKQYILCFYLWTELNMSSKAVKYFMLFLYT